MPLIAHDKHSVPDRISVHGPDQLLELVPYLIGFQPRRSLVIVGLESSTLAITVRVDLPSSPAASHEFRAFGDAVRHAVTGMLRANASHAIAVVYCDHDSFDTAPVIDELVDATAHGAVELLDVLHVVDGRWASLVCADEHCAASQPQTLATVPSEVSAAATVAGLVVREDRAAVAALIAPRAEAVRAALDPAIAEAENCAVRAAVGGQAMRHRRSVKRALFAAGRAADTMVSPTVSDADVARFGVALGEIATRDSLWMAIDDGRIDGRQLWRELGARLPAPYDAAPMFLFAWASWRHGDGVMARLAVERVIESDPSYSAADLLLAALTGGVDPRRLPRLRGRPA